MMKEMLEVPKRRDRRVQLAYSSAGPNEGRTPTTGAGWYWPLRPLDRRPTQSNTTRTAGALMSGRLNGKGDESRYETPLLVLKTAESALLGRDTSYVDFSVLPLFTR